MTTIGGVEILMHTVILQSPSQSLMFSDADMLYIALGEKSREEQDTQ